MFLAYVDESFKPSHFSVGALIGTDQQIHNLRQGLDKVCGEIVFDFDAPMGAELHGYEIFHGKDDWESLHDQPPNRIGVYHRVIDAIAESEVTIKIVRIDSAALKARQDTENYPRRDSREEVAWRFLLQRISTHCDLNEGLGLVIADEGSRDEERRSEFESFRTSGTPGDYRKTSLDRLIDTVHFAPSDRSRPLQAIDCALFIAQREYENRQAGKADEASGRAVSEIAKKLGGGILGRYSFETWPP